MTFALWLNTDAALALINRGVGEAGLRQAWKEHNRNQAPGVVALWPKEEKPAKKNQRQEFQELLAETEDMIVAAKREGHWQLLPALLQRHETFAGLLANRALN